MYPFVRLAKTMIVAKFQPPMTVEEVHVGSHICWPWDLDIFAEMNNGRVLSIYDLGRFAFGQRIGLTKALAKNGWGLAVAGATIRYRRRVHAFHRFQLRTKVLGYDARFIYIQQTMVRKGNILSSAMLRTAVTNKAGIVPTEQIVDALGFDGYNPELPDWAKNWIDADSTRPWPPEE